MVLSTVISARFWADGVKLVITIAVGGPSECCNSNCFVAGIRNEGRWRGWRGSWHVHGDWVYVDIGGRTFRKRRGTLKLHRAFFWWYRDQLENGEEEPWARGRAARAARATSAAMDHRDRAARAAREPMAQL